MNTAFKLNNMLKLGLAFLGLTALGQAQVGGDAEPTTSLFDRVKLAVRRSLPVKRSPLITDIVQSATTSKTNFPERLTSPPQAATTRISTTGPTAKTI
jgi:hypothetical protein